LVRHNVHEVASEVINDQYAACKNDGAQADYNPVVSIGTL